MVCFPPILDLSMIELIFSILKSICSEKLFDELIIFRPLKEFPTDPLDNSIFPVNLWLILNFPNGVFPNFPKFLKGYILLML